MVPQPLPFPFPKTKTHCHYYICLGIGTGSGLILSLGSSSDISHCRPSLSSSWWKWATSYLVIVTTTIIIVSMTAFCFVLVRYIIMFQIWNFIIYSGCTFMSLHRRTDGSTNDRTDSVNINRMSDCECDIHIKPHPLITHKKRTWQLVKSCDT